MHLAQTLLHLINLSQLLRLPIEAAHKALALRKVSLLNTFVNLRLWGPLELLKWRCNRILFNDSMKLINQSCVELVDGRALFLRITTIVDANLLVRVMKLPGLTLVLVKEIYNEEWVLEVDEEVTHVCHFLWLLLILDDVKRRVSALVVAVDLIFKLFLCIAARDVFHAQVCSQFKPLFN